MTQRSLDWRAVLVLAAAICAVIGALASHYAVRWLAAAIVVLCLGVLV